MVDEGSLSLSDSLNLDYVLIIPSLYYNLMSIVQIIVALDCNVIFWPTHCVFQNIHTRKEMNCGIRKGKLYYLDLVLGSETRVGQGVKLNGDNVGKQRESLAMI